MSSINKATESLSKFVSGPFAQAVSAKVSETILPNGLPKGLTQGLSGLSEGLSKGLTMELPKGLKETFYLRAFGFLKIPMLFFISPTVIDVTDDRCAVRVKLSRKTKNHLNSMYFGVLAAGADCAGGLIAMRQIQSEGNRVSLIFKDFHADFLKRAEGDVVFSCEEGSAIRELVRKASESGERENMPVHITATVPSKLGDEPIAKFILTLSLKRKASKKT